MFKQRNLVDKTVSTALIVMIALCVLGVATMREDPRVELKADKVRVFYGQPTYWLYSIGWRT